MVHLENAAAQESLGVVVNMQLFHMGDKSCEALYEMLSTTPTNVAGCAALLRQIEAFQIAYYEPIFSDWRGDISVAARNLLSRIAAKLEANA